MFKFVHTADVHLDSPLKSLSLRDPEAGEVIANATRQSFSGIIDLCLEEGADALLIAGDLYDGDMNSVKTAGFFAAEMRRLNEGGVQVFIVKGNHDAESKVTRHLVLPENVHIFSARGETVDLQNYGIAIHGLSFKNISAPDSLLPMYPAPMAERINIGLLHTSLAGYAEHDSYSPCSVQNLIDFGYDYWALGHIHKRTVHHQSAPVIVMPGIPQGRSIKESGPKSVTIGFVHDNGQIDIEERPVQVAQFERIEVDVSGLSDMRDLVECLDIALGEAVPRIECGLLVARLNLVGSTPLAPRLERDLDLVLEEARQAAARAGKAFVELVELDVSNESQGRQSTLPIDELASLMKVDELQATKEQLRQILDPLTSKLPLEVRNALAPSGTIEGEMLNEWARRGMQKVIARLVIDDRESQ
ncbi:MAG: DNA repair exonuclease [Rhodobiaceae bacterium]|nr:DNA repair exonuclease [Rhodobiaceae bacterium]